MLAKAHTCYCFSSDSARFLFLFFSFSTSPPQTHQNTLIPISKLRLAILSAPSMQVILTLPPRRAAGQSCVSTRNAQQLLMKPIEHLPKSRRLMTVTSHSTTASAETARSHFQHIQDDRKNSYVPRCGAVNVTSSAVSIPPHHQKILCTKLTKSKKSALWRQPAAA